MKKQLLFISIFLFSLLIILWSAFQLSKSRTFQFFGGLTNRISTTQKVVALTFDDAPSKFSDEVLQTLKEKQVKATFYVIGKALEEYPQAGKNIVDAGHELGNHSYSHQRFLLKSQSFIANEIEKTNALIRNTGYTGEITFRPPNGKKLIGLPYYLHKHNMQTIMWDVEPDTFLDSKQPNESKEDFLVQYTLKNTQPGSIILLHPFCESCSADRQALGTIIDKLKEQGYTFLTANELLKMKN